jgi:uncharacterized membrane protein YbjE (DUF340 family)
MEGGEMRICILVTIGVISGLFFPVYDFKNSEFSLCTLLALIGISIIVSNIFDMLKESK